MTTFSAMCETAIEINCSEHRLQRIGENRRALVSATFEFSFAKSDQLSQFKLSRHFGQSLLIDQIGPDPRQVAFGKIGKMPENQSCDCAVEHTVAKKFQALVVR